MKKILEEITEEEYNWMNELDPKTRSKEVEKNVPLAWYAGYGYYGARLVVNDNGYFIEHTIGGSCD